MSRLYQPRIGKLGIGLFAVAFVLLLIIVIAASPGADNVTEVLWIKIKDMFGG